MNLAPSGWRVLCVSVPFEGTWNFLKNFEEEEGYGRKESVEKEDDDHGGCRRMVPDAFTAVGHSFSIVVPYTYSFSKRASALPAGTPCLVIGSISRFLSLSLSVSPSRSRCST